MSMTYLMQTFTRRVASSPLAHQTEKNANNWQLASPDFRLWTRVHVGALMLLVLTPVSSLCFVFTAKAGPTVSGLLPVQGVPLEVPPADPPHVRLFCHAGLVRPLSRAGPRLLLHPPRLRQRRHFGGVLQRHPAPGEPVLQRLCLHPAGLPGDALCGLPGGVLALLLQDGSAGSRRVPGTRSSALARTSHGKKKLSSKPL